MPATLRKPRFEINQDGYLELAVTIPNVMNDVHHGFRHANPLRMADFRLPKGHAVSLSN
jgi:hypothetical protein